MQEAVERRYRRLQEEHKPFPSLILIDGGLGQLHAAAQALERLEVINQPLASIAKKEEILYVLGREDEPVILDRHSPVLHLIQQIRDEYALAFAVTFHRQRRATRRLRSELTEIPGVGAAHRARKLLQRFGSIARLRRMTLDQLEAELPRARRLQRVYAGLRELNAQEPRAGLIARPARIHCSLRTSRFLLLTPSPLLYTPAARSIPWEVA